ncbi:uncharacterized protein LOC132894431 [Neoarius graeffei]|uniref:uncharacterized protein LOC132894431 n=1 Tax=Neoarius graeffei TaxID=443677 RepID=UPI00298CFE5F|nr:uncharacterized protein LOC132894431 [Neoarius graeffei]
MLKTVRVFCGNRIVDLLIISLLMCFFALLSEVTTEPVKTPPPTVEIIQNGSHLNFIASPPNSSSPHCWQYTFQYRKCNEKPVDVTATEKDKWLTKVEYDAACKYTVQVQAKYDTMYCGKAEPDSDMSKPVYFGVNGDPSVPFKVVMIIIPVIVCACLFIAIVLYRRYKDKILPKVPRPSDLFKDMMDNNREVIRNLELYVPKEEVVDKIHAESTCLQRGF